MPQPQNELSAADIRRLLSEKFPPTTQREKVYVSVTLALLDNQEIVEAHVKGLAELLGRLLTALEISPQQLLAMGTKPADAGDDEVLGGGGVGPGGMGGSGAGASAGGAGGGGGAGPTNPIKDATPFPSGTPTSAPPGTKPAPKVTSQAKPAPVAEEIPKPDTHSGPPVNARPNVTPPPANGAPKAS